MKPYLITTLNINNQSISRTVHRAKNIKKVHDHNKWLEAYYEKENIKYPWKVLSVEPVKKKGGAVVYARVSTFRQSQGSSFERQITATSDWAFVHLSVLIMNILEK